MIYGPSGSTKTSQLYHAAKYIHRITGGKKLRLIHSDPGGYAPFEDSGMIERGEVEVYNYGASQYALADFRRLSMGYWPKLVRGNNAYPLSDRDGGEIYFKSEDVCKTQNWDEVGGYLIDGISSIGEVLKNHCSDQDEGVGFKPSWKYEEDGYTITGLQEGHYGLVQKEIHSRFIKGFSNLPIPWLLVTALVGKGEDKQRRETVYGPQIVGNAATPQAPTWFGDCIHLELAKYRQVPSKLAPEVEDKEVEKMVAWFTQHNDSNTGITYLCKPRLLPEQYPKLLEYFPYGFVPLGYRQGIDLYFAVLEKLRKEFKTDNAQES